MGFFYFIGGEIIFILGVIPARKGSKGIPGKNVYPLNGRPLIEHTIDAAKSSSLNDWVVTTNDPIIMSDILKHKNLIVRPDELAEDDTPMLPVIQHAVIQYFLKEYGRPVDAVMILQPTSPLRTTEDINKAIQTFNFWENNSDSLYSGYCMGIKHKSKTYDKHTDKPHFQRNGAIFIAKRELIEKGMLWSDNVLIFKMPKSRSIDIDDMDDMFMAEAILKHREVTR